LNRGFPGLRLPDRFDDQVKTAPALLLGLLDE
jgi:hypothetical protein